jgi:hypothetical protein
VKSINSQKKFLSESFEEFCRETFIECIPSTFYDEEEEENNSNLTKQQTLTERVYDSLTCVDWRHKTQNTTSQERQQKEEEISKTEKLLLSDLDDKKEKNIPSQQQQKQQTHPSSLIDSVSSTLLEKQQQQSKEKKKVVQPYSCELPPNFIFDRVLKKSVPRSESSSIHKNDNDDDDHADQGNGDDDDDDNDFSELLKQMREVRDSKKLTREEREKQAAALSQKFASKLHQNDDLADEIAKNLV